MWSTPWRCTTQSGRWLVLVTSIGVDYGRLKRLRAVAQRTGTLALATDAFHFASDIWSTVAVLCGLGASWVGAQFGIGGLRYADPFAAVVVSLMILRMTVYIGRETVSVLMDEVPIETRRRLVREVSRLRACSKWNRLVCGAPGQAILRT